MSTPAPDAVKRLVDCFDLGRKVFLFGDYKEEQLRAEFLNPRRMVDVPPNELWSFAFGIAVHSSVFAGTDSGKECT